MASAAAPSVASRLISRVLAPVAAPPAALADKPEVGRAGDGGAAVEAAAAPPAAAPAAPAAPAALAAPAFTNPLHPSVVPVLPAVKQYAWGVSGARSAVAALYSRSRGAAVAAAEPYAELWIGTHTSTPCPIRTPETPADAPPGGPTLRSFIQDQVIMVDPDKVAHYSSLHASGLPFLLKVLSVAKPLSIQAHPDLSTAAALHASAPHLYSDANHKPELAVALSPFQALAGFRPMDAICADVVRVPEFADAVGRTVADAFVVAVKTGAPTPSALRHLFSALMTRDPAAVAAALASLVTRLAAMDVADVTPRDKLLLHLHEHYPGDVGCFAAYYLVHLHLDPGQSIFIDANEPHAYLSGDCVEIMATSDNVVRAGLTGKPKDVDTLVSMLSYSEAPMPVSEGVRVDEYAVMYAPPVKEFMLVRYTLPIGVTYEMQETTAPTVIIVLGGEGYIQVRSGVADDEDLGSGDMMPLSPGSVYYLKAATTHTVTARASPGLPALLDAAPSTSHSLFFFRAGTNEAAIPSGSNCSIM